MNSPRSKPDVDSSKEKKIEVPRDPDVDSLQSSRRDVMPSPDTINMPDEEYPAANKPLPAESPIARKLHEHPPQGDDQLEVGSAGDAARPTKTGIMNPNLPPRGQMK